MSELRQRSTRTPEPAGIARHGKLKSGAAWKSLLAIVASGLAVVLVSGVSVAGIATWQLQANIDTVENDFDTQGPPPAIGAYEGGFNILLVGSDTREGQGDAFGKESSTLNDVNMLLHVAQDQKSAVLVSIPRDMVVPLPECENGGPATGEPINTTLYYGGLSCTVETVQNLTGLPIQFAGIITFNGVIAMSDAVGGVEVCITEPINDPYTGLNLSTAGAHTLEGWNALAFLRSRHGVGDGSDLGRISSQQVFLSSLVRKIKSDDTLTDFGKLYGIAQAATQNMTLSENFARLDTLVAIALVLKDIPLENIAMVQYPSRTGGTGIYLGKVQPITSTAKALFDAIKADVPIALDANAVGANGGSTLDPNAPTPTTPDPSATSDPSPTPEDPGPAAQLVPGLKGQTADQYTCSVAN
ncbi:LCP family protein [Pseudolysinimonas sp.]|uniref:LCP family protein n=1 Tax=Pseudolysinimonas sp. TaxID=2680009 RepID=UPI00286ADCC9|nr:LCP family protein [Pseudolysinimonas sp.]